MYWFFQEKKNAAVRISFGKSFDTNVENESQILGSMFWWHSYFSCCYVLGFSYVASDFLVLTRVKGGKLERG